MIEDHVSKVAAKNTDPNEGLQSAQTGVGCGAKCAGPCGSCAIKQIMDALKEKGKTMPGKLSKEPNTQVALADQFKIAVTSEINLIKDPSQTSKLADLNSKTEQDSLKSQQKNDSNLAANNKLASEKHSIDQVINLALQKQNATDSRVNPLLSDRIVRELGLVLDNAPKIQAQTTEVRQTKPNEQPVRAENERSRDASDPYRQDPRNSEAIQTQIKNQNQRVEVETQRAAEASRVEGQAREAHVAAKKTVEVVTERAIERNADKFEAKVSKTQETDSVRVREGVREEIRSTKSNDSKLERLEVKTPSPVNEVKVPERRVAAQSISEKAILEKRIENRNTVETKQFQKNNVTQKVSVDPNTSVRLQTSQTITPSSAALSQGNRAAKSIQANLQGSINSRVQEKVTRAVNERASVIPTRPVENIVTKGATLQSATPSSPSMINIATRNAPEAKIVITTQTNTQNANLRTNQSVDLKTQLKSETKVVELNREKANELVKKVVEKNVTQTPQASATTAIKDTAAISMSKEGSARVAVSETTRDKIEQPKPKIAQQTKVSVNQLTKEQLMQILSQATAETQSRFANALRKKRLAAEEEQEFWEKYIDDTLAEIMAESMALKEDVFEKAEKQPEASTSAPAIMTTAVAAEGGGAAAQADSPVAQAQTSVSDTPVMRLDHGMTKDGEDEEKAEIASAA